MGACGCGDYVGEFTFPGPGDTVYSLAIYLGCIGCDQGPGITIHRHATEQGRQSWGVAEQAPLVFHDFGDGDGDACVPVLGLDTFRAIGKKIAHEEPDMADIITDDFVREIPGMVAATLAAYRAKP